MRQAVVGAGARLGDRQEAAGFDPLRDEGRQYADAMRAAGTAVDYREYGPVVHGFANFFTLGGASATATSEVISAIRAHLTRAR